MREYVLQVFAVLYTYISWKDSKMCVCVCIGGYNVIANFRGMDKAKRKTGYSHTLTAADAFWTPLAIAAILSPREFHSN